MKTTIFLFFLSTITFSQNFLPAHDTVIQNKDGSQTKWQVQSHAIYMTTYKNDVWNGPSKSYYKNGQLWCQDNRVNGKIEGASISYTPSGDTATIEEWKNSRLIKKIIYYQNTIPEPQKYYFVSKKGFPLLLNGVQAKFDSTTPDSLVEEGPDNGYMWLKGEKKLLYGKEVKYITITTGDKPGNYKVIDGEQIFMFPLTESQKKQAIKPSTKSKKKK